MCKYRCSVCGVCVCVCVCICMSVCVVKVNKCEHINRMDRNILESFPLE